MLTAAAVNIIPHFLEVLVLALPLCHQQKVFVLQDRIVFYFLVCHGTPYLYQQVLTFQQQRFP